LHISSNKVHTSVCNKTFRPVFTVKLTS